MHASDLPIPAPCSVPWESMEGSGCRRLCGQCNKHVHDLSAMTEREARRVAKPGVCVQYRSDRSGRVVFRRAGMLAAAGALLSAPAFAGQKQAEPPKTEQVSVFEVLRGWLWGAAATPEGTELVEVTVDPTTPLGVSVVEPLEPMVRGEIAFHPPTPPASTPATTTPSTEPVR